MENKNNDNKRNKLNYNLCDYIDIINAASQPGSKVFIFEKIK
jgi:hypothetical protein